MKKEKSKILLVDDEADLRKTLVRRFLDAGYEISPAENIKEARHYLASHIPDLILLDIMMPEGDGFEFKEELNQNPLWANIPLIFLSARAATADKVQGLSLRAEDYVTKPFDFEELQARVEASLMRKKHYENLATTDPLTGLANKAVFHKQMEIFFNRAVRYKTPFSIAVIDIDDFKKINDSFGHSAGDSVLAAVTELMKKVFRQADILIRYGGDEFVVLFCDTPLEEALKAVDRFEAAVRKEIRIKAGEQSLPVGVSIGVSSYQEGDMASEDLFRRADEQMYASKAAGKGPMKEGRRILIVEDEDDVSKLIIFRLKKAGFHTVLAKDGEEGLRMARRFQPDLLLLDLMLPKLSGEEICKAIREDDDPAFSKMPILMLTAKVTEADRIVGKVIGANCYMTKPFRAEELLENIFKLTGMK